MIIKKSLERKSTKSFLLPLFDAIEWDQYLLTQSNARVCITWKEVGRLNQQTSQRRRRRWWCTDINNSCRFDTLSISQWNAWLSKIEKDVWGILKRHWGREHKLSPSTTYLTYLLVWSRSKCIISHATVNQNKQRQGLNQIVYIYISRGREILHWICSSCWRKE